MEVGVCPEKCNGITVRGETEGFESQARTLLQWARASAADKRFQIFKIIKLSLIQRQNKKSVIYFQDLGIYENQETFLICK